MNHRAFRVLPALLACAALAAGCFSSALAAEPTEDELKTIRAYAPAKATVQPAKPRSVLVFTLCNGFVHSSVPYGAAMVRILGEKTGAWTTTVSDDPAVFEPASLAKYDAVVMDNTTQNLFLPKNFNDLPEAEKAKAKEREAALKASFLSYVRNGGGLVGIHAATDCFYEWEDYGVMMGGYFNGHPWNEKVGIKVDDPNHPINAAFHGVGFSIADEIYMFKEPYSRENLRILLSLDTSRTDMTKNNIKRDDGDFAVSWVREEGKGRVFYCSLGHRHEVFWTPQVLQHYLDGIQYALGDLKADATPSATAALFDGSSLDRWDFNPGSWEIIDGTLARVGGGDIWSKERFGDFILDLEFMVTDQTNSGIFIRTDNVKDNVQTGIEIQVLDSYGNQNPGKHDCGAVYDCLAPSANAVKPRGEWNTCRVVARGPKIEVTLNGQQVVDMNLDKWTEANKNPDGTPNKFKTAYKDMKRDGHIGFQDHGRPVWFRNVFITPLD